MEIQNKNNNPTSYVLRQSSVILISRIIVTELVMMTLHYLIRILIETVSQYFQLSNSLFFLTIETAIMQLFNLYILLMIIISWMNEHYILNPKEVIIKKGVINTKSITYEFANLQSMSITQNIWQKIFNYGTIKLFNPVLREEVYISNIPDPYKYGEFIQQYEPQVTPIIRKSN